MIQYNSELLLALTYTCSSLTLSLVNIYCIFLIHEVKRLCLSVCEHNAITNAISSCLTCFCGNETHATEKGPFKNMYKHEQVCSQKPASTIPTAQPLMEWRQASGEWMAITPLRLLWLRQLIVVPAEELPFGIGLIDKNMFNNQPGQLTIVEPALYHLTTGWLMKGRVHTERLWRIYNLLRVLASIAFSA